MPDDPHLTYHRSQVIRDPYNAAYHEAAADLIEARAEVDRLRERLTWIAKSATIVDADVIEAEALAALGDE